MDLGVSSFQLDEAERGFSHRVSAPLDLRMDPSAGETAAQYLGRLTGDELTRVIREYGEDSQAARIARAIAHERKERPIETTDHLARVISEAVPATRAKSLARVFQALRIAVNHELEELGHGLQGAWNLLSHGGRLVVISYHSLEDRMVKEFMNEKAHPGSDPRLPFPPPSVASGQLLTRKVVTPTPDEIEINPRARSAKLRAIEKVH
jgi:16S rRNA (cytosine1402-N4)-methyltransferase